MKIAFVFICVLLTAYKVIGDDDVNVIVFTSGTNVSIIAGGKQLSEKELIETYQKVAKIIPSLPISIMASTNTSFGVVMRVAGVLSSVGLTNVSFRIFDETNPEWRKSPIQMERKKNRTSEDKDALLQGKGDVRIDNLDSEQPSSIQNSNSPSSTGQ